MSSYRTMIAAVRAVRAVTPLAHADTTLLNVSYDPTRELYEQYNAAFAKHWKTKTGEDGYGQAIARRLG